MRCRGDPGMRWRAVPPAGGGGQQCGERMPCIRCIPGIAAITRCQADAVSRMGSPARRCRPGTRARWTKVIRSGPFHERRADATQRNASSKRRSAGRPAHADACAQAVSWMSSKRRKRNRETWALASRRTSSIARRTAWSRSSRMIHCSSVIVLCSSSHLGDADAAGHGAVRSGGARCPARAACVHPFPLVLCRMRCTPNQRIDAARAARRAHRHRPTQHARSRWHRVRFARPSP